MTDLTELIEKKVEEPTYALFRECYVAVFGEPQFKAPYEGHGNYRRFRTLLDAGAWTDAAMMLMPEGWCLLLAWNQTRSICNVHSRPVGDPAGVWPAHGEAQTPALAIVAAALKARAALASAK